jgi:hypothetical protein
MSRVQHKAVKIAIQDTEDLITHVTLSGIHEDLGSGVMFEWVRAENGSMAVRTTIKLSEVAAIATYKALGQILGYTDEIELEEGK